MALGAFVGAMLALTPTLAAFTATVGASSSLTAGGSPTVPNTPVVPFMQLSLAPIALVVFEGRKTELQGSYTPSFTWIPIGLNSQETTALSHEGAVAYTHKTTPRFESTVTLRGTFGSVAQSQLRNPNSLAFGAPQGGSGRVDNVSFTGSLGSSYLFTRRWSYAGTVGGQVFQATDSASDDAETAAQQGTASAFTPQRTISTQQTVSYLLTPTNSVGLNGSVGVTRSGRNDLLNSTLTLSHARQVGVVSRLTLAGGVADFSALPGSVAVNQQERTSATAAITFTSEGGVGARRAAYDISLQWAPGVDVVLGETRDRVRLAVAANLPLDTHLTAGVSAQVSTATDRLPSNGQGVTGTGDPDQTSGPVDETLLYISLPFAYAINREWTVNWGGTASWTAPHWRLPFELNNPYYAAFVGVGFQIPVYQTR